jgi:hypothetical protein
MRRNAIDALDALPTGRAGRVDEPVRRRTGAVLVALAGVLFLVYPAVRPWTDETTLGGARGMASNAWIVAHLSAIAGFILLALGLQALYSVLRPTTAGPLAARALVVTWLGVGLTLPYYGVEVFGAHVIAQRAVATGNLGLLDMVNEFRFNPAAIALFIAGLLLLAVGIVLAATAIWRSRLLSRWSGVPAAIGFTLFIPQFFAGAEVRIAHGALIAAGCLWLTATLWRKN